MSTKASTRWVVALTGIGSLMAALDTVVVATALTTIRGSIPFSRLKASIVLYSSLAISFVLSCLDFWHQVRPLYVP